MPQNTTLKTACDVYDFTKYLKYLDPSYCKQQLDNCHLRKSQNLGYILEDVEITDKIKTTLTEVEYKDNNNFSISAITNGEYNSIDDHPAVFLVKRNEAQISWNYNGKLHRTNNLPSRITIYGEINNPNIIEFYWHKYDKMIKSNEFDNGNLVQEWNEKQ